MRHETKLVYCRQWPGKCAGINRSSKHFSPYYSCPQPMIDNLHALYLFLNVSPAATPPLYATIAT